MPKAFFENFDQNEKAQKIFFEDMKFIHSANLDFLSFYDKTFLITGAGGFLASYIVEFLLHLNSQFAANIQIIGLVRNLEKAKARFKRYQATPLLQLVSHDVATAYETDSAIDYIIHAASNASPKYYGVDPVGTAKPNVLGTYFLLELALKKKVSSFLFISSGEVYGQIPVEQVPIEEATYGFIDPTAVRSCYGESKRMGENLCASFNFQFQVPAKIVRPFHTYGPGMALDDGRVFSDFVANILKNQNIEMKSSGTALRAYCYITDAITGFFTVLLNGKNGSAYNVGNPEQEASVIELAERLVALFPEKKLQVKSIVRPKDTTYLESPIARNSPNVAKLKSLGWNVTHTIESGFKKTVESYSLL